MGRYVWTGTPTNAGLQRVEMAEHYACYLVFVCLSNDVLLLCPQVHAAINDRFVLNIMHQFDHKVRHRTKCGPRVIGGRRMRGAYFSRPPFHTLFTHNHTSSQVNLREFMGYNTCFSAGADKGVAYDLYNR